MYTGMCGRIGTSILSPYAHIGYFRHLLVRKAVKTGEILVDLVTASDTAELGVDPAEAMKKSRHSRLHGWKR